MRRVGDDGTPSFRAWVALGPPAPFAAGKSHRRTRTALPAGLLSPRGPSAGELSGCLPATERSAHVQPQEQGQGRRTRPPDLPGPADGPGRRVGDSAAGRGDRHLRVALPGPRRSPDRLPRHLPRGLLRPGRRWRRRAATAEGPGLPGVGARARRRGRRRGGDGHRYLGLWRLDDGAPAEGACADTDDSDAPLGVGTADPVGIDHVCAFLEHGAIGAQWNGRAQLTGEGGATYQYQFFFIELHTPDGTLRQDDMLRSTLIALPWQGRCGTHDPARGRFTALGCASTRGGHATSQ